MSLLELADIVIHMSKKHCEILKTIEKASYRFQYVPLQYVAKKLSIKPKVLERMIGWLVKNKLLRRKQEDYVGFALTYKGADALAIKEISSIGIITQVGPKIGMGKDGDIWIAYLNNKPRIIKLYRISPERFKHVRLHRYYTLPKRKLSWLEISKILARNEFRALSILYRHGVNVPRPIMRNRHIIVMDYIPGRELIKTHLTDPLWVFRRIIEELVKALKTGIVHADLSEFNILVTEEGEPYIIDWPQFVTSTRAEALNLLERDVLQITKYFSRKYKISVKNLVEIINEEFEKRGIGLQITL